MTGETSARRILVTGATGFMGRHALVPLQGLGFEVHAITQSGAHTRSDVSNVAGVTWHTADLLSPEGARAVLEAVRPTHLLHFAWYAEHGKFWSSPLNLNWLSATLQLLRDFAESGGTRFVGAGTCAEYDWTSPPFEEAITPLRPATLYGAAKSSAFLTGEAFAKSAGIEFAWGRVFHLFGAGENAARIVPTLMRTHLRGERLDCGAGSTTLDLLPVSAVGEAFAALCASPAKGAINIGSGRSESLEDLSARIARLAVSQGDVRFGILTGRAPEHVVPVVDRLLGEVGWTPPPSNDPALTDELALWRTIQ